MAMADSTAKMKTKRIISATQVQTQTHKGQVNTNPQKARRPCQSCHVNNRVSLLKFRIYLEGSKEKIIIFQKY
jgi:hypothetical protein